MTNGKHCFIDPYGERHAEDRDDGECRIFGEHPEPELHVEPGDACEGTPFCSAAVGEEQRSACLADPRDVAEPFCGGAPCRLGAHALRDIVAGPLLEVKLQFLVHLLLGMRAEDPQVARALTSPANIAPL
jgi:hypothetical protein